MCIIIYVAFIPLLHKSHKVEEATNNFMWFFKIFSAHLKISEYRHPGLQGGVSRTSEGEETHGCQNRRTAKLETDVGFHS